jgi:hypothetical protein
LLLAGNLKAKHPFSNSIIPKPSRVNLLKLLDINLFENSAQQYSTHYCPAGNCDVFDIFVHKDIRLSEIIFSGTLDSDHPPIVFHLLHHIRTRKLSDPVDNFRDLERFQNSELISSKIQINSKEEAEKAARDVTASIPSAYRLTTSKITLLDLNKGIPALESLLKHKRRLRKLWQETRDSAYKTKLIGSSIPSVE